MRVAVLGCTGSIGRQTLDVCRKHADKVEVVALSARSSVDELCRAAREFGVRWVGVADEASARLVTKDDLPAGCELCVGEARTAELGCLPEVDCVVLAVVGFAGIEAALAAVRAGKRVAYANKESIVVAGDLLMPMLAEGQLVPVDSEHSAIFQSLVGESAAIRCLWLTCSGGPFFGWDRERLRTVSAADALAHPTWSMGAKITIDSATLMNKGLEVLEAHHLFGVDVDDVRVLVHPQSRIHSMVEFVDGSVKAQLGPSDMRIPIQYGLSYPDRWEAPCVPEDWRAEPPLAFGEADEDAFGCLRLARVAGRTGGTLPCAMNAANEVANAAFRKGMCGFLDIERLVGLVMERTRVERVETMEQLRECDRQARMAAHEILREVVA